jgi:hypothetical protein
MRNDGFRAPFLTYDALKSIANNFLVQYHPDLSIPVPIEEIIEFKLNIEIILLDKLKQELDVEGFISNDLKRIYVDEWAYSNPIGFFELDLLWHMKLGIQYYIKNYTNQ